MEKIIGNVVFLVVGMLTGAALTLAVVAAVVAVRRMRGTGNENHPLHRA